MAVWAAFICTAVSADEDVPDAGFLEYLGSWESSDADWVMLLDNEAADAAQQESLIEDAESREQEDDG